MTSPHRPHRILLVAWAVTLAWSTAVAADPMRPLSAGGPPTAGPDRMAVPRTAPPTSLPPSAVPDPEGETTLLRATRRGHDGRWQALLGDRWVSAGDRLGDARVAAVDADRVRVERAGASRTLHLLPPLAPARKPWPSSADTPARTATP